MCTQYPEIIITSPKEPAAFYSVPQTVQENLLTTNYEQWCALYSMDDEDISLEYVSSNLQRERRLKRFENDYQYSEEYRYEYNDFDDDDFFDKYPTSRRMTLENELNNYNNTHTQKYECYDNREYNEDEYEEYYEDDEEGFDYEYDYEFDDDYEDEEVFDMEEEPVNPVNRPRLNYDIIANAISRRFNKSTDSDVSDEEDEDEDENDDTIEPKIIVKTPSIKASMTTPKSHRNFFQKEGNQNNEESNKIFDFMETIKTKFGQKEMSSSVPTKSGFSIMNEIITEGRTFGMPEAMSNKHDARNSLFTHRKSSSLQGSIVGKTLNENNFSSLIKKDCEMILNGPMKNRKRAYSLNEPSKFNSLKLNMNNNKNEFRDLKKSMLFCF